MVDHLFDAMEWIVGFMDGLSWTEMLQVLGISAFGSYVLVAAHEFGHALASWSRGLPVTVIRVCGAPIITFRLGATRVELGQPSLLGGSGPGGYVVHGPVRRPSDAVVIALAGPAANVVATVLCGWIATTTDGVLQIGLTLISLESLFMAVHNLIPRRSDEVVWNDGRQAAFAWSLRHEFEAETQARLEQDRAAQIDPRAATSVPPPPPQT